MRRWSLIYWPVGLVVGTGLAWWGSPGDPLSLVRVWAVHWPWLIVGWWAGVAVPARVFGRRRSRSGSEAVVMVGIVLGGALLTSGARLAPRADQTGVDSADQFDLYDVLGENYEFRESHEWRVPDGARVEIHNSYGPVRVLPSPDDRTHLEVRKMVRATSPGEGRSRAEALNFTAGLSEDSWLIAPRRAEAIPPAAVRTHLEMRLPPEVALVIVSNRGPVEVAGLSGSQTIFVRDGGALLRPDSGPLEVHALRGDVRVVWASAPEDPVSVRVEEGDLRIQLPGDGNVEILERQASDQRESASVRVAGTGARMELNVVDGALEIIGSR